MADTHHEFVDLLGSTVRADDAAVLKVKRKGLRRSEHQGDLVLVRQIAGDLGVCFPQPARALDAALTLHLSGTVLMPAALPAIMIHDCGGAGGRLSEPEDAVQESELTAAA